MRLLLDEQLDTREGHVADALNGLGQRNGLTFRAFHKDRPRLKMTDPEVVEYCRDNDFDALISFNHKDFGKKKALYRDLVACGVSVVVLRPPEEPAFRPERQAALLFQHLRCIAKHLDETPLLGPILLKLTATECVQRTLQELEDEFAGKRRLP